MSIKSILRAVGGFLDKLPAHGYMRNPPPVPPSLQRLKGRSDWLQANPRGCAACNWTGHTDFAAVPCEVCQGRGLSHPLPIDPAPAVAPWDTHSPDHTPFYRRAQQPGHWDSRTPLGSPLSNVWPVDDDPYAKLEPCTVVQDPGLSTIRDYAMRTNENTRRLAERGLSGRPMDSVKSVMNLLQLIERQEAAERELIHRGMEWDPVTRRWIDPETQP